MRNSIRRAGSEVARWNWSAIRFDALARKRNDLPQHNARQIRRLAERWIAHHVEIRESGKAERLAETVATRAFEVQENLGSSELVHKPSEERVDLRSIVLPSAPKAIRPAVFSGKRRMPLQDNVGLPGNPLAAGI